MKKLSVFALLLVLCLCLCACGESEKPEEIADIPNIDHNILDADRHLGNSYENYSSEDTLLVEYGNRIYHAYNSRHEIMEYCTANDKEKSLGIYGTDLSVYKNILYYIGKDSTSIHAYDLATGIDSVWITREQISSLFPLITFFYPTISNLLVSDYGLCFLFGESSKFLVHLSFDQVLISTDIYLEGEIIVPDIDFYDLVPISSYSLCAPYRDATNKGICIYNLSSASLLRSPLPDSPGKTFFDGGESVYLYSYSPIDAVDIVEFDLHSFSTKTLRFFKDYTTIVVPANKFGDYVYYNVLKDDFSDYLFIKKSLSDNSTYVLCDGFAVTNLTFTSNNMVYGMTDNYDDQYVSKFFRADLDFKSITYLD